MNYIYNHNYSANNNWILIFWIDRDWWHSKSRRRQGACFQINPWGVSSLHWVNPTWADGPWCPLRSCVTTEWLDLGWYVLYSFPAWRGQTPGSKFHPCRQLCVLSKALNFPKFQFPFLRGVQFIPLPQGGREDEIHTKCFEQSLT